MATVVRRSIFTSRDAIIEQSIIFIYTADLSRYKINRQSGGKILCLLQCCAKQSWLAADFVVICRYKIGLTFLLAASESPLANKLLSLDIWYEFTFHIVKKPKIILANEMWFRELGWIKSVLILWGKGFQSRNIARSTLITLVNKILAHERFIVFLT